MNKTIKKAINGKVQNTKFCPLVAHKSAQKFSLSVLSYLVCMSAIANPQGGSVVAGDVQITQTQHTTQVVQSTEQAIIEWRSFNIGNGERTNFQQPANGIALNRINPNQGASQIYGSLTANGTIILVNPAGLYFGSSSFVNVGGLIATTSNISNENFLNKNYTFDQATTWNGKIVTNGIIKAAENGLIALLAGRIENNGLIQATMGKVVLASGTKFTLNFTGDQLVNFSVDAPSNHANITNRGYISADGGKILISAQSARQVLDRTINMEGVLEARSIGEHRGEITLFANEGTIDVSGRITATGFAKGTVGGDIKILAKYINIGGSCSLASLNVNGDAGGGNITLAYQSPTGELTSARAIILNHSILEASAIKSGRGGNIALSADALALAGDVYAKGLAANSYGGTVDIKGNNIKLYSDNKISVASDLGEGTILLQSANAKATDSIILERGSLLDASAMSSEGFGGYIKVNSAKVYISGRLVASDKALGGYGGLIEVGGGAITLASSGVIDVSGSGGGGKVIVGQNPLTSSVTESEIDIARGGQILATGNGVGSYGGSIILFGKNTKVAGKLDASATGVDSFGGVVNVLALNNVTLTGNSSVNVSGVTGGGRVLIGGSEHGAGIEPNAQTTTIEKGSLINASATGAGSGGYVIVWANGTNNFAGTILAKGGNISGDGGYVQVAGVQKLNFTGKVDVSAPHGEEGTVIKTP